MKRLISLVVLGSFCTVGVVFAGKAAKNKVVVKKNPVKAVTPVKSPVTKKNPVRAALPTKKRAVKKTLSESIPNAKWASLLKRLDQGETQGEDLKGMMKLVLINKAGKKRYRKAIFFQKGTSKRLIQFKHPASEAGITVLIRKKNIHLYLPQFQRIRRIAAHVKNQPFMGTDLSFDDFGSLQYAPLFKVKSARQNAKYIFLTLQPKADSSRSLQLEVRMRRADGILNRVVYFDRKKRKMKILTRSDFRKVKGFWMPFLIEVKDLQSGHRTQVIMTKIEVNTGISNRFFSLRYLKRTLDL